MLMRSPMFYRNVIDGASVPSLSIEATVNLFFEYSGWLVL